MGSRAGLVLRHRPVDGDPAAAGALGEEGPRVEVLVPDRLGRLRAETGEVGPADAGDERLGAGIPGIEQERRDDEGTVGEVGDVGKIDVGVDWPRRRARCPTTAGR